MNKKISYEKRLEVFRDREAARKHLTALMSYNIDDLLSAVISEAEAASEPGVVRLLKKAKKNLDGHLPDDPELTLEDIFRMYDKWKGPNSQVEWAFTPEDIRAVCESLLIAPFELYRVKNHGEYQDILRKYN